MGVGGVNCIAMNIKTNILWPLNLIQKHLFALKIIHPDFKKWPSLLI
jgi:hypothetical protein